MAIVKETICFLGSRPRRLHCRNKLLQLLIGVEVVIPLRSGNIEPVGVTPMKSKISDGGSDPRKEGYQLRQLWFVYTAVTKAILLEKFESRLSYCFEILNNCKVAEVVKHETCNGTLHLEKFFSELVGLGAEGVMLRRPGSNYEPRRTNSLLKFKPFNSEEAEVIGHQAGEGKHEGRLGSLICKWNEVVFNLGTGFSDELREEPPKMGAQVSFLFQGLTDGGVPRFPVFLAERSYE